MMVLVLIAILRVVTTLILISFARNVTILVKLAQQVLMLIVLYVLLTYLNMKANVYLAINLDFHKLVEIV